MGRELIKLEKKLKRLEKKYDKARGLIERERIMKSYNATKKRIEQIDATGGG